MRKKTLKKEQDNDKLQVVFGKDYVKKENDKICEKRIESEFCSLPLVRQQHSDIQPSTFQSNDSSITSRHISTDIEDKPNLSTPNMLTRTFGRIKRLRVRRITRSDLLSESQTKTLPASSSQMTITHLNSIAPPSSTPTIASTLSPTPTLTPTPITPTPRERSKDPTSDWMKNLNFQVIEPREKKYERKEFKDEKKERYLQKEIRGSNTTSSLSTLVEPVEKALETWTKKTPPTFENKMMFQWTVDDVCMFLHKIGLPQYQNVCDNFIHFSFKLEIYIYIFYNFLDFLYFLKRVNN
jgi:hypothetical protein